MRYQFALIQVTLAKRVRTLRKHRGLSQERLALEAGIDRTYQSQIERGIANPSIQVLCALATVLGVGPADLISEERPLPIFQAARDVVITVTLPTLPTQNLRTDTKP